MDYKKHPNYILDSCCLFFSVDTGAKIVGYIGVVSNSINITVAIALIVALAVNPTPTELSTSTTTELPTTTISEADLNDDIDVKSFNLRDDIDVNRVLPDIDLNTDILIKIIILVISLGINMFTLSSNVIMLMGLYKRIASYVKFGLVVGIVSVSVDFAITVATFVAVPSVEIFATLLYFVVPFYLLLVVRSAYYNMLEIDVIEPIYTFGQPHGKGTYYDY